MKSHKTKQAMGRWAVSLLVGAGIQIQGWSPAQAATPEKTMSDKDITYAIEDGLVSEQGVFPDDIDVSASHGVVTLFGAVDNILAKERAIQIAESIRGVLSVIDRITVTPVSRSDSDIRKDILTALLQDPATESYQVAVSVQDKIAKLTGTVGSYAERQLAARIAKGVKGVKEVREELTIDYRTKRTDAEIAADVKDRLQWDIWVNGYLINATAKDGKVTLTGTVGGPITKSRAYEDAWVNGVTAVDVSGMKIELWAHNDARRKLTYLIRSDGEIKKAVQAALLLDPRVSAFSPDVTVEDGVVILGGAVGDLKAKISAEQDARNTVGVGRVDNLLKVRPKGRPTDAEMQSQLRAALSWDPSLDSSTMEAAVINRVAYLAGAVDSVFQKIEAQEVASRIKGVLLVHNHLKVEPESSILYYDRPNYSPYSWSYGSGSPYFYSRNVQPKPFLSDEEIKKNIEKRFFWSPFVDRDDIKVTVDAGVVTLTGTVGTWIGWYEADKDAHKSGAAEVLNRVTVKNGAWF